VDLDHVTFVGPPMDDAETFAKLPPNLAGLLRQFNGLIQFGGGFHVRGACFEPLWHSLRDAWFGPHAFHRLYPAVLPDDVPFAEDCMGDQFILRDSNVFRLRAETGELGRLSLGLAGFFHSIEADPIEFLSLQPLLRFQGDGGALEPGQLLGAYPPFCTTPGPVGHHFAVVPSDEQRRFLADFAAQIRDIPDGGWIEFRVVE
jgi:hypothetical protein